MTQLRAVSQPAIYSAVFKRSGNKKKTENENMELVTVSLEYTERAPKKAVHAVNFEALAMCISLGKAINILYLR